MGLVQPKAGDAKCPHFSLSLSSISGAYQRIPRPMAGTVGAPRLETGTICRAVEPPVYA